MVNVVVVLVRVHVTGLRTSPLFGITTCQLGQLHRKNDWSPWHLCRIGRTSFGLAITTAVSSSNLTQFVFMQEYLDRQV